MKVDFIGLRSFPYITTTIHQL